jgi:hypothetical protein
MLKHQIFCAIRYRYRLVPVRVPVGWRVYSLNQPFQCSASQKYTRWLGLLTISHLKSQNRFSFLITFHHIIFFSSHSSSNTSSHHHFSFLNIIIKFWRVCPICSLEDQRFIINPFWWKGTSKFPSKFNFFIFFMKTFSSLLRKETFCFKSFCFPLLRTVSK